MALVSLLGRDGQASALAQQGCDGGEGGVVGDSDGQRLTLTRCR